MTSEAKFTKGPWTLRPVQNAYGQVDHAIAARDTAIAVVFGPGSEHDAHLIASAPDMYEALKRMVAHYDRMRFAHPGYAIGTELPAIVENARAALSKAEGAP